MVRDSGEGGARRDNGCRNKDTGWGGTAFTEPGTYSSNGTRDLVLDSDPSMHPPLLLVVPPNS